MNKILNIETSVSDVVALLENNPNVKNHFLTKNQFCLVSVYKNKETYFLVVSQEKSKKVKLTCSLSSLDKNKVNLNYALLYLGFKVKL